MLVQDIMTRQVVAIGPDMPIGDVNALMEQRNIRHFPIIDDPKDGPGKLVGIVSDRDIRTVGSDHPEAPPGLTHKHPVRRLMVTDILTAHPLDPVEEAAKVLCANKIGAMPVLDGENLVGIVTGIDFLEALVHLTGVHEAATRLDVELPNRPGALAGLLTRIATRNYAVVSVMTAHQDRNNLIYALRVNALNGRGLVKDLQDAGYSVVWPQDKP